MAAGLSAKRFETASPLSPKDLAQSMTPLQ
jgi:hypothetical protein